MSYVTWDDSLAVHVEEIDNQHKKLFALINELHEKMVAGLGTDALKPVISSLFEYLIIHFSTEEKIMMKNEYPGFESHKKEHDGYVAQTKEFARNYKAGSPLLAREVLLYLGDWYRNHILKMDKKLGEYLQDRDMA